MQALYTKYQNDGLVILAVSLDQTDIAFVRQFVASQNVTFPTLHDQSTGLGTKYSVRGVPSTFLIDHQGQVLGMVTGPRQWDGEDVDKLVQQLLLEIPHDTVAE